MSEPRPDPDSSMAGETEYGNDTGFAQAATGTEPDAAPQQEAPAGGPDAGVAEAGTPEADADGLSGETAGEDDPGHGAD